MSTSSNRKPTVAHFPAHRFLPLITFAILIALAIFMHLTAPTSAATDAILAVDSVTDGIDAAPGDGLMNVDVLIEDGTTIRRLL